jgi:hypothetical protein
VKESRQLWECNSQVEIESSPLFIADGQNSQR